MSWLKNRGAVVVVLVVGTAVVGLGTITNSLMDIATLFARRDTLYHARVRERDGSAIATAKVTLPGTATATAYADSDGEILIALPAEFRAVLMVVEAPGYPH